MAKKKVTPTFTGPQLAKLTATLESTWVAPKVADLPLWPEHGKICIDTETKDPELKTKGIGVRRPGCHIIGYSFTINDDRSRSFYVPLRHEGGDNVEDPEMALRYIRDQAKRFRGILVGAKLDYDLDYLAQEGADFLSGRCRLRDIQIADPLINELHWLYNLEAVCERWGLPGKDEALLERAARHFELQNMKAEMHKLPARYVGEYAAIDSLRPLQVLDKQEKEIEKQNLWSIFNLECEVQRVLIRMRRRGVAIDCDHLDKVAVWALQQETEALAKVKHATGINVGVGNVWKAAAIAPVLTHLGIEVGKTPKTGKPKVDKEVLSGIDHPVANHLAWARKVNKLRTTFVESVREHMVDGRIHTTFNQLRKTKDDGDPGGAAYGRLSSEKPNLQQQPSRDEFAPFWRKVYVPEPDTLWGSLDYSQQEPRMLIHYADLIELPGASEAAQQYRDNPSTDYHQMVADMAGIARSESKILFLAIIYGMGGAKLCHKLGLPTRWAVLYFNDRSKSTQYFETREEAEDYAIRTASSEDEGRRGEVKEVAGDAGQALINQLNSRLPFLKKISRAADKRAKEMGYIVTILGRRCRFPEKKNGGGYDWTHKALNRLVQGSSADQTKKALVDMDAAGHYIQLQVHDEVAGSFPNEEAAYDAANIMSNCIPNLRLPFKVDTELGSSWGASMEK